MGKRQISEEQKRQVLQNQTKLGVLHCFIDYHPVEAVSEVEFHHITPFSEGGPSEISNIGAVCKDHHRRIRTLSLSEFRDQLEMDRFFAGSEPKRLDDLLQLKVGSTFGSPITVSVGSENTITLHFPWTNFAAQSSNIFVCPATSMQFFYASLPVSAICNDAELQPRPLEQKRVWELYRHLSEHTQLAPAVCRLVDKKILLFDGQHKSAAQIWAGRKFLDCKIYIDPPIDKLKDTNLVAHDKLRQMPFFTSTLLEKYGGIFKQQWLDYMETDGPKTEANFIGFLRSRGKTVADAKRMLLMAIEQDIIESPENALSEYISERNRSRRNPFTVSLLQKTFFKEFVLAPPSVVEFEGKDDYRQEEKKNLVRLMSMIASQQLAERWNPDANNPTHKRAERIFTAGVMRTWVPMLRDIVAQVLQVYDEEERRKLLFRPIDEARWLIIEGRVRQLFSHKIWDDPSPEVASRLKVNSIEEIKSVLHAQGCTVGWVLGSSA